MGVTRRELLIGAGGLASAFVFADPVAEALGAGRAVAQVFVSTAVCSVVGMGIVSCWGTVDFTPGWTAMGWLLALALGCHVLGWVLIGVAVPKLPSEFGVTLLLMQPVLAALFSMIILNERPDVSRLLGCVVVIGAVWFVSRGSASQREPHMRAEAVAAPDGKSDHESPRGAAVLWRVAS